MHTRPLFLLLALGCQGPIKAEVGDDTDPSGDPGDDTGEPVDSDPLSDADGDGYAEVDGDCDDLDPSVHPGADEIYYDGEDQNCDGADDYDADGDGHQAADSAAAGDDCDDQDPTSYEGAVEALDHADNDCDVFVDEDFINPGDVWVGEILANPSAVGDAAGEWLELESGVSFSINLIGWTLTGEDGALITIDRDLILPGRGQIVLGAVADDGLNGGAPVDFAYERDSFPLDDTAGSFYLNMGPSLIFSMSYDAGWALPAGASLSLDPTCPDGGEAEDVSWWCASTSTFGDGDRGTPGEENDPCPNFDHDGDGVSPDDGDCDDTDPDTWPNADEQWDGVDNDCDGLSDNLTVESAVGYLDGDRNDYLGYPSALAVGDFDGDGQLDVAAGAPQSGGYNYTGVVYLIDGAGYDSYADDINTVDFASVDGANYNYLGAMDPHQGDQNGDGADDLFITGADTYGYYYDSYAGGLFFGGSSLSGNQDIGDADVTFAGSAGYSSYTRGLTHLDIDGDGADEVIYGDYQSSSQRGYVYGFWGGDLSRGDDLDLDDYDFRFYGRDSGDRLGQALGGGDVDGDGHDDLLLSAPYADDEANNGGAVYVVLGDGTLSGSVDVASTEVSTLCGDGADDNLGAFTGAVVGDFKGDGVLDVAVGSPHAEKAYIYMDVVDLSGDVPSGSADVKLVGSGPEAFSAGLASGDVNGDGRDDLLVGAPDGTTPGSYDEKGSVFLFYGASLKGALAATSADASFTSLDKDLLGLSVIAADLGGDGHDDLLVTASLHGSNEGRLWFFTAP